MKFICAQKPMEITALALGCYRTSIGKQNAFKLQWLPKWLRSFLKWLACEKCQIFIELAGAQLSEKLIVDIASWLGACTFAWWLFSLSFVGGEVWHFWNWSIFLKLSAANLNCRRLKWGNYNFLQVCTDHLLHASVQHWTKEFNTVWK